MAEITQKKVNQKAVKAPTSKVCEKCGENKPFTEFAPNKDWVEAHRRDAWCRDCVKGLTTKREVQEYFWVNNRAWNDTAWTTAKVKAEKILENNEAYIRSKPEVKEKLLERITCQNIPNSVSLTYKFEPHYNDEGRRIPFTEAESVGLIQGGKDKLIYSKEFNGKFTKEDLDYLETYYSRLEEDFNFDNESLRDYARKVCKASLASDKAQADFAAGKISYSDVKDAMNIFDMLSKSANFAACRRKSGEASGLTCWAETTLKLESSGIPIETKVEFEKDDIDKTIDELRHIVKALGLDSI